MLDIENDDDIFIFEEPKIYYSSTSNIGVSTILSERNANKEKIYNMPFSPPLHNNKFSIYNTIMLPSIKIDTSLESIEYNNTNNINNINSAPKEKVKSPLKKDNAIIKIESSKEEKNIDGENQLINIFLEKKEKNGNQKEKNNTTFEKNPFFLGKPFSINNYNKNIICEKKSATNLNRSNSNEKNENDMSDFFKNGGSKSYIYSESKTKNKNSINEDDKSENIIKKSKKLSIKNDFLNLKLINKRKKENQKLTKEKPQKKKLFLTHSKNKKEKDESFKLKKEKQKFDSKNVNSDKKTYYYSNKCVINNYNINYFKSTYKKAKFCNNKEDNNSEDNIDNELKMDKKRHKYNNIKTQRLESNFIKSKYIKDIKDENKVNKKAISNKYKSVQPSKAINMLKEYIKTKDKEDDSPNEKSFNLGKGKKSVMKHSSKNKTRRMKLSNKDSDFEEKDKKKEKSNKFNKGKSIEKDDLKTKIKIERNYGEQVREKIKRFSSRKLPYKENNIQNNSKINKCLTADLSKKKNSNFLDKNLKLKNALNSNKKRISAINQTNLFKKENNLKKKKDINFEFEIKNNLKKMQFNLFSKDKFTNTEVNDSDYLKYTLDCMELILDIDIEKQTRLKNKINFNFPKPKKNKIKKIALFDLDETLVHCTGDIKKQNQSYQHAIEIKLPGKQEVQVGINLRPFWKQTLNLIKKNYYIAIYTASHQAYADSVLDFMDPKKKYFKYRLYRNNCSLIDVDGTKFYVKDLDIFNEYYDLKDIVIIDNSVLSFAYHLHNGIPIVPYYEEDKDGSLYVVGLYLNYIFNENDLREANKQKINLDSFLEEAKKNKEERYIEIEQIEEESCSKEDDNENIEENREKKRNKEKNEENEGNENDGNNKNNGPILEEKCNKNNYDSEHKIKEKNKLSDKKIFLKKRSSNFLISLDHKEQDNDAQKKLMSQSKLINMYYECKNSNKTLKTEENKDMNENIIKEEIEENKEKNIDSEYECKSDPGQIYNAQTNLYDPEENQKNNEENHLKRLCTIIDDTSFKQKSKDNNSNKNNKFSSKTKLGFIRSNFYNNFKI